ncbi:glycosyl hydrolase family 18 [Phycicoccus sp. BSK3Z-2]|uniref:Glycosyl hydrolase family 18 n=1 Tax=Phycicoccus avicenniae TaxID=2828860 RepID=A0A941I0J5_9MICO|nr:carbohydrate-binding protein [Phycicoccus avicenniae]MBR7743286.1 glycosyl hydrolase family 18 [Phycicoccus avicenniae]
MSTAATAPTPPRMRVSPLRVAVVVLCTVAVAWFGSRAVSSAVTPPPTPGPSAFSGYVDVTATPAYPFETPRGPAQSDVTLAFVVSGPEGECTPMWGGAYTLDAASADLDLDRRISQLRLVGGQVRVSFGGQAGTELASTCTDTGDLARAYWDVVDRYEPTVIDLDLEGTSQGDAAAAARRVTAIREVQERAERADRPLSVWLTLPVAPTGLTAEGEAVLDGMLAGGVEVAGVNGMTMDFNAGPPTPTMGAVVLDAATALHTQVASAWARAGQPLEDDEAWERIGITPMIGQNDVVAERFTLDDAVAVNEFARTHGVGLVSMWSLNRDSTCAPPLPAVLPVVQTSCSGVEQGEQRFADLLAEKLGSGRVVATTGSPTPSPSASRPTGAGGPGGVVDDPETSPFPIWDPLGRYPGGTKIVWQRQVYVAKYWTTGVAPDASVARPADSPWTLVGPVLPGDTPAPLPTVPDGTYPEWDAERAYTAGMRVVLDGVPYEAKWWSQGQVPGENVVGGSPWLLVVPGS